MQVKYPQFPATSIEGKAIAIAKPFVNRISANHSTKIKLSTSKGNNDIVCKTIVSKPAETILEKVRDFLGLVPQRDKEIRISKTSTNTTETNLADYVIRDVQNTIANFDIKMHQSRKLRIPKNPDSPTLCIAHPDISTSPKTQA